MPQHCPSVRVLHVQSLPILAHNLKHSMQVLVLCIARAFAEPQKANPSLASPMASEAHTFATLGSSEHVLLVPHRWGKAFKSTHQLRMSPLRLAHMDSPADVAPHWVGYSEEHWMPHMPFVHRRVPCKEGDLLQTACPWGSLC